ncbi:hypothetical protein NL108_002327 [Boleophthalmus pectinirostris]|uniref:cystatin-like n=1 Tax=Boleophthalmus pectinirostris TaxID=150288 RepID=UPI000A1C3D95|nr:cystatin-like [Boleophthalmus pectinirostris]KAJ0066753.1 hypothetical protein NL108_002327 [Boleophthalmus pectinirostris]
MEKTFVAICCSVLFIACASAVMPGGISDIENLNENEGALNALAHAVRHHNSNNNHTHLEVVSEVLNARSQVVSGSLYYFTVLMATTNCTTDSVNEPCTIPPENAKICKCEFQVWSQPWLNSNIVTEKCEN